VDATRPSGAPDGCLPFGGFEEFVAATGEQLTRTAVLLTGDRHAAEDLVQTTFAHVFSRWRRVRRAEHPVAYTRTILTRLFLAQQRRRRVSEVAWDATAGHPSSSLAPDPTLRLPLMEALATLSPADRTVLVLRYFHDLPAVEVARELGVSEGACRTRTSRALARLRLHFPDLAE